MCGDDYSSGWGSSDGGFFSSGWGDSNGDGYTSISEALEYDYLYKSTTGEDFDDEGDSAYFSSSGCSAGSSYSGNRVSRTISPSADKTEKEIKTQRLCFPQEKITSLWDDRWELVSLFFGVVYFAAAIFVFSKFEKIGLYVLEPMAIVALLIITLVAGVFVWSMLYFGRLFCKHLDPYPDYFNELPKKPWNIYGEPESDKTWFTFFLFYSVFLLMAFDPEGTKNKLSLTDKGTNIFMAMVFFTPIFFFLILKIIKTVKLIKVKEELMRDLPKKKTPIKINPGKIFTAIIVIGLLASGVSVVSENKEKADAEAEILYREIKTYIAAEQYDKAEANLEKMEKLNRGLYKNTKAFSLFCKAKDAYERGEEFESYKLLRSIDEIGHDELEEITGYIRSDYFEHQEIVKEERKKFEERKIAEEKASKQAKEEPKEVKVTFVVTGHSSEKSYDPYNAKDYGYVEDFYDDHYDDFFDLDDAEDYYMDHYND